MLLVAPANATEKLRVGKAVAFAWTFTPLDIGIQTGIFAKHGLEIEASNATGDAKLQQALTADSLDVGIGSGPGMAFMAKGVPAKAVAAMAGVPRNMAVMVGYNSTAKAVDDLKGRKLGVTTVGSLTDWIGKRINALKGWGAEGITTVPIGGMPPARAAIKTGQIDGYIGALETGYALEEAKEWRVITTATPFVDDFITHVIFVREDVIAKRPETVRSFLKGWFETIAFMRSHKADTVKVAKDVMEKDEDISGRVYDELMPMFSDTGRFDKAALATLSKSYVELKLLPSEPDMSKLCTEAFLPK